MKPPRSTGAGWRWPARWRRGRRTLRWERQRDMACWYTLVWTALAVLGRPYAALGLIAVTWWLVWMLERRRQHWTAHLRAGWVETIAGPAYAALTYQPDREAPRTRNPLPSPQQMILLTEHDWHPVTDPPEKVTHWRDRREHKAARQFNRWRRRAVGLYVEPWHARMVKPRNRVLDHRLFKRNLERETGRRWRFWYDESSGLVDITLTTFADQTAPPDPDPSNPYIEATGTSEYGTPAYQDRRIFPHRITGGSTRYGKTTRLRNLAYSAIWHILNGTGQAFIFLDPKRDQLYHFTPQALGLPVLAFDRRVCRGVLIAQDAAGEVTNMAAALSAVVAELRRRQDEQAAHLAKTRQYPDWSARLVWIAVDEQADLARLAARNNRPDVMDNLDLLLSQGAGFGILVDLATQSPRAEVLTGQVKANAQGRTCCGPADPVELQVIFGKNMPEPPPYEPGMAVTRDAFPREPTYPYVVEKGYHADPSELAARLVAFSEASRLCADATSA